MSSKMSEFCFKAQKLENVQMSECKVSRSHHFNVSHIADHTLDVVARHQIKTNVGRRRAVGFGGYFFEAVRHPLEPSGVQFGEGDHPGQAHHFGGGPHFVAT